MTKMTTQTQTPTPTPTRITILAAAAAIIAAALFVSCGPSPKLFAQRMESSIVSERRAAAKGLRAAKRSARLVPIILLACRDEDADVRMYGFFALGKADPREEGVVSAILDGVNDTVVDVRRAVAAALGDFDPFPNTCLPHMVRMLTDPDDRVRKLVSAALSDLQGAGVGSLMRNLEVKDEELRLAVIGVLTRIGPDAKAALPMLRKIAQEDPDLKFREAAARAVKYIEN